AGVSGIEPFAPNRPTGLFGHVPIALHVLPGAADDLSDFAWGQVASRVVYDPQFGSRVRLAARAHPSIALSIVLLWSEVSDCTGGLGQSVYLGEAALEGLYRAA